MKLAMTMRELRDILISVIVLGFIFSFRNWESIDAGVSNLISATLLVGIAYAVHELGHKISAEAYNCSAEFVLWPKALLLSLAVTVLTKGRLILAVPGYIAISTAYFTRIGFKYINVSNEEYGKIASAGPILNLFSAFVFKALEGVLSPSLTASAISINTLIAVFNLLPLPPLDGSRVLAWRRIVWMVLMAASILLAVLLPLMSIFFSLVFIIPLVIVIFILGQNIR